MGVFVRATILSVHILVTTESKYVNEEGVNIFEMSFLLKIKKVLCSFKHKSTVIYISHNVWNVKARGINETLLNLKVLTFLQIATACYIYPAIILSWKIPTVLR